MGRKSRLTTLCYIEKAGAYLMSRRVSKKSDADKDKWIGVGGHFERDKNSEDCLLREVRGETGLAFTSWRFRGLITFIVEGWDTKYMCLYTADKYEGEMILCNEGALEWVKKEDVLSLNLWEGDKIFFKLLGEGVSFFSLRLVCQGDWLSEVVLDGKQLESFDVPDADGKKIGAVREQSLVHMDGVPHRTAHIWVVKKNKGKTYDLLLWKRNRGKDSYPGCYDTSSAGHVQADDEFLPSAIRELKEELGIEAGRKDLELAGCHRGYMEEVFYGRMFRNSEVNTVYVYNKPVNADRLTFQKKEMKNVTRTGLGQCVGAVRNNGIPNCIYPDELEMIEGYLCRSQEK